MDNRIEKNIELEAPVSRVWRALANHKEFGEWFGVELENSFQANHPVKGRIAEPGLEHLPFEAVVQKMESPRLFSFTWHPYAVDLTIDYSKETPTLVEFRLEKIPEGTLLTVTESDFDKVPGHRRSEAYKMHVQGWAQQMENIQKYLENRP